MLQNLKIDVSLEAHSFVQHGSKKLVVRREIVHNYSVDSNLQWIQCKTEAQLNAVKN